MRYALLALMLFKAATSSHSAADARSRSQPLDVSEPEQLAAVIAAYAQEQQIILFAYVHGHEGMYADMGRELALTLDGLNRSYVVLGHGARRLQRCVGACF